MPEERQQLSVAETCALVNKYLEEAPVAASGRKNLVVVAQRLGWTLHKLADFRRDYAALLNYDDRIRGANEEQYVSLPETVLPPTDADLIVPNSDDLDAPRPPDDALAESIIVTDRNLMQHGLMRMGFTPGEAEEAEALQKFNRGHFMESMEIVASNGMRTSMKLAIQQREIESRLVEVRTEIRSYGGIPSDERTNWLAEERMLMRQFTDVAAMIDHIQATWFKGTAVIAAARMRVRHVSATSAATQRSNKPGFRPAL